MKKETILIGLILIFLFTLINTYNVYAYTVESTIINVYEDGSVLIIHHISISIPPEKFNIKLLGQPVYIEARSLGTPIPVEVTNNTAYITAPGDEVTIEYLVSALTNKVGENWVLSYMSPYSTTVILPENTMIYEINPKNFDLTLVNETVGFIFPPGSVEIKYILIPQVPSGGSGTTPQPSSSPASFLQTLINTEILTWLGVIIIACIAAYLLLKRLRSPLSNEEIYGSLDARDNKILNTLSKYGEMTAKELIEKTRIPKTPLYRRLRKLSALGLIESVSKAGITYYRVKVRK